MKIRFIFLICLFALNTTSSAATPQGNCNGDGSVNIQDIICTADIILNSASPGDGDCTGADGVNIQDIICTSNQASSTSLPVAVYNQAYQENYEEDQISYILANAHNAYVLVDPFPTGIAASIPNIKANGNEVGAYISIGTGEDWRDDHLSMVPYLVSTQWGQWAGEYFVNSTTSTTPAPGILALMKARIDQIAIWGADWVEFDNMDWVFDDQYRTDYGFIVTEAEGIAYYQALCNHVHLKGMKCMAKNMTHEADIFDGVLYESYGEDENGNDEINWWDVAGAHSFLAAGKLVIINHYNEANCNQVYIDYKAIYGNQLSFICEDKNLQKYIHYNQ